MRALAVASLVLAAACGDDDGTASTDAGAVPTDAASLDAAADDDAAGPDTGPADAGATDAGARVDAGPPRGTMPPIIRSVSWTHGTPCTNRDRMLTVTTTVEDPDTAPSALRFSGEVYGCTGALDAATSTVTCRGTSTSIAYVRVTDEGGRFDEQGVNVPYCDDGSTSF